MPPDPQKRPDEYWRSLNELADAPEFRRFLEAEFPSPADSGGMTRRRWLQALGVSLAAVGVGGCWQREEILPFDDRPPERVPGKPHRYATAMELGGSGVGLLVTSFDGRPIKVEGNPKHPQSLGATDAFAQAAIFEIYDPDRSQAIIRTGGSQEVSATPADAARFLRELADRLKATGGKGFCVLGGQSSSPTLAAMRKKLLEALTEAAWYEYEPISDDNDPYRVHFDLAAADVIVSLDADLLSGHPASIEYARRFAERRRPERGPMNRLYAVESVPTCTGAAADHRLPLAGGQVAEFAAELSRRVSEREGENEIQGEKGREGDRETARTRGDDVSKSPPLPLSPSPYLPISLPSSTRWPKTSLPIGAARWWRRGPRSRPGCTRWFAGSTRSWRTAARRSAISPSPNGRRTSRRSARSPSGCRQARSRRW
jgi:molybdopterin-containing oxidoreductase family iron-sulfur binding subunit